MKRMQKISVITQVNKAGEKKSAFVYGMKCPMKDVGVVLDDFLQSLLVMHMLVSLPEAGK